MISNPISICFLVLTKRTARHAEKHCAMFTGRRHLARSNRRKKIDATETRNRKEKQSKKKDKKKKQNL